MRSTPLAPLLLLLGYGLAFGAAALGVSLPAFDDHPGQLYRLWHVTAFGPAPWAWNPGWWTGYPELQFYPPGFAYAGALLNVGSLGALSLAASYQILVWVAYLLPGLSVGALLARVLGNAWAALPGAFVALTLSGGLASGVEGGVHIGMVPARLAWGLVPLVPLAMERWSGRPGSIPSLATLLVAAIALTHPAHLPAAALLLVLVAVARRRREGLASAALALTLAGVLTAFWSFPLLVRLEHTRALAWGALSFETLGGMLGQPLLLALVGLAAWLAVTRLRGGGEASPLGVTLTWFPWIMVLVVALDRLALEPLGVHWLPADRVADSAWLAFVLAAGLALGRRVERGERHAWALAVGAVVVAVALSWPGETLTLWAKRSAWPSYQSLERGLRLPDLWATLRGLPPGRILFVRSGVPLVYGSEWWRPHTHVTALAPMAAGRAIVHGTFTHPSPVAKFVYGGLASRGAITGLAEQLDGRTIFGLPVEQIGPGRLDRMAENVGASAVVMLDEDVGRFGALEETRWFERRPSPPPFVVYARRTPVGIPEQVEAGHWRVTVTGRPRRWVSARIGYYPLWRVEQAGAPLLTDPGDYGDLEVLLGRADAPLDLYYAPGLPEKAGVAASLVGALAWLATVVFARPLRRRNP